VKRDELRPPGILQRAESMHWIAAAVHDCLAWGALPSRVETGFRVVASGIRNLRDHVTAVRRHSLPHRSLTVAAL